MDTLAMLAAGLMTFGFVTALVGYRLGKEDGRIEERKALYWRTHRLDRERM